MPREFTYGPFNSRRLKLSLGVDVLPSSKKCTYNCIYCELGITRRDQLVSPEYRIDKKCTNQFKKELRTILKYVPHLNSITFGYNGEPTLNENLTDFLFAAKIIREQINWKSEKPILTLFTNSSTLYSKQIRERVSQFEWILAKLDVANDEMFRKINRPHKEVPSIRIIVDSLVKLRNSLPEQHKLAIQSLIFNSYKKGYSNESEDYIWELGQAINEIEPDMVQLYSIARIPAEYYVYSIGEQEKMEIIKQIKDSIGSKKIKVEFF
ncbi:MAG: radical SAM protein [Candidatus Lokiarchaeota archaeon]|nr:radical SAM protein [Candidatus Lokiarchaeota archaeon]